MPSKRKLTKFQLTEARIKDLKPLTKGWWWDYSGDFLRDELAAIGIVVESITHMGTSFFKLQIKNHPKTGSDMNTAILAALALRKLTGPVDVSFEWVD